MTTNTVSAADPVPMDAAFESKPVRGAKSDGNAMMAGADMYRRMQGRPKSSATAYLIGGVAAIALLGGGAYVASHQLNAKTSQVSQTTTTTATSANQQAQASNTQAQAAQKSAQASADAAQAQKVAQTGAPPAAATDTQPAPKPTRVVTRTHETAVHRAATVVARQTRKPSPSAVSSGVDASAVTPPPPVTVTQPAPAVTPAPTPAPMVIPAPAPAPSQTQAQPPTTTPPQ
jgi:hypothetical protein